MRIVLTSIGTAGDVNPFIALGYTLRERGHAVALLLNPYYEAQVRAAGLEFLPLGRREDLTRLADNRDLLHPRKGQKLVFELLVKPNIPLVIEALEAAHRVQPIDFLVYQHATIGARWVAARHAIPCALAALSPLAWMSAEDGSVYARSPLGPDSPRWLARLQMHAARPLLRWMLDRQLAPLRRRYGFAPLRDIFLDHIRGGDLNLGLWSPRLRPPAIDDPPRSRICGFTWFDRGHNVADEDRAVAAFLDAGDPPIVFTMGSTATMVAGDFYTIAASVCQKLGRRGMLLVGEPRNTPADLPVGVGVFGYAPYSQVLPRSAAIVHHGGVGTTAQALRCGKPTVIIPIVYDEFDNAARAARLGTSLTLARKSVSRETLLRTLVRVLQDTSFATRAQQLGAAVANEDGAVVAADAIENVQCQSQSALSGSAPVSG